MIVLKSSSLSISLATRALLEGKLVVLPTDTVYGFSTLDTKEGEALIRRAKGRKEDKPFIRLIASPDDLKKYTAVKVKKGLLDYWPAALTLVVPVDGGKTAAFRCPADTWLRALIAQVGSAIFSTSVNASGEAPLTQAAEIEAHFKDAASFIVQDDPPTDAVPALPSTIVDVSSFPYRVLRQGSVVIGEKELGV